MAVPVLIGGPDPGSVADVFDRIKDLGAETVRRQLIAFAVPKEGVGDVALVAPARCKRQNRSQGAEVSPGLRPRDGLRGPGNQIVLALADFFHACARREVPVTRYGVDEIQEELGEFDEVHRRG